MTLSFLGGRRGASVLAAAVLLSLTAACGPADLEAGAPTSDTLDLTLRSTSAADRGARADRSAAASSTVPTIDPTTDATTDPAVVPTTAPIAVTTTAPAAALVAHSRETNRRHGGSTTAPKASAGRDAGRTSAGQSGNRATGSAAAPSRTTSAPAGPLTNRTASFSALGHTADYRVFAEGVDTSKPVGLLVYADGTGEYALEHPTSSYAIGGSGGLAAVARAHNMVLVTPFSPNRSCQCWEQGDAAGYADYLAALISQLQSQYSAGQLWFAGYSSGAQAATRFLFPAHPELWSGGGGVIAIGGGGAPAGRAASFPAQVTGNVVLRWDTGAQDTGADDDGFNALSGPWGAQAGQRWYAARGFNTQLISPAGVNHDRSGQFGRIVDGFLR